MTRAISHIEIPAQNRAQLAEFYESLFGWKTEDMQPKTGVDYTVWHAGPMRGGFTSSVKPSRDGVLLYIESPNIEADLEAIVAAGGAIVVPKTQYPAGWFAQFSDPAGNLVGLSTRRV